MRPVHLYAIKISCYEYCKRVLVLVAYAVWTSCDFSDHLAWGNEATGTIHSANISYIDRVDWPNIAIEARNLGPHEPLAVLLALQYSYGNRLSHILHVILAPTLDIFLRMPSDRLCYFLC